jgi:hypothetical protein
LLLHRVSTRLERRHVLVFGAAVVLASLWLRAGFPVVAIGPSVLDDALFLRLARSLLAGQWLGTYDNATLAKGMFYPLFIAASFVANIPLKVAEQLVYLSACAWLSALVGRQSRRTDLGMALFVLLALNPVMWLAFVARVVREGLYVTLTLLVIGSFVTVLFCEETRLRRRVLLAVASGVALGCFWLTREEGPWIIPSLAVCVLLRLVSGGTAEPWRVRVRFLALSLVVVFSTFAGTLALVKTANWYHYGVYETNEFRSSSFQRGYGALARIRHDHWRRYVVFPADARQKAYAVSGAARELRTFFEGADGARWRAIGCEQTQTSPCPEILSGWFMWALRDAVAQAGHYRSAREANAFYERLADEIDAACSARQIDCLAPRSTLAPPFRAGYLLDMGPPARQLASFVFRMGEGGIGSEPSMGSTDQMARFAAMTGGRMSPAVVPAVVSGWVASAERVTELSLRDKAGRRVASRLDYVPAPDVAKLYPSLHAVRFRISSPCLPDECTLRLQAGAERADAPLRVGAVTPSGSLHAYLDSLSESPQSRFVARRQALQWTIAAPIASLYALLFPLLSAVGAVALVVAAVRPAVRRRHGTLVALGSACLVGVLVRIALLAYLDATSIPSANGSYAMPVSPLVVLFAVIGVWLGWVQVRELLGHSFSNQTAGAPSVADRP